MLRIMQYIGKRAPMYCTGIGKLLLNRTEDEVRAMMGQAEMKRYTSNTITAVEPPAEGTRADPFPGLGHRRRRMRDGRPLCRCGDI